MINQKFEKIVQESVSKTLENHGFKSRTAAKDVKTSSTTPLINEAVVVSQRAFPLKTEFLSNVTKEVHFRLYKQYVESFNQISSKLDTTDKIKDPTNPNNSDFRRLKEDEQHNLNGVKLHELYFTNISDLNSKISADSIVFQRLARDWGSFENWQFDFRACGLAATEGWAVLYFDSYKQRYLNTFIEKHTINVPVGGIPVLVVDTWHHAWFRDYPGEKMNYLNAMMREINWNVIEARMSIAEKSNLHQLFMVQPVGMERQTEVMMNISNQPPIQGGQVVAKIEV